MNLVALLHAQAEEAPADLGMPTFVFGLIALVIFAALLVVLLSFRDVANRHSAGVAHADSGESTSTDVQSSAQTSDE